MPVNSRRKGAHYERLAAKEFTAMGLQCSRMGRNGYSDADLKPECEALRKVHVEVKADRAIKLGTKALDEALEQADEWVPVIRPQLCPDGPPVASAVLYWDHPGWCLAWHNEWGIPVVTKGRDRIKSAILRLAGEPC